MSTVEKKDLRNISHREFVVTWVKCETLQAAADALGITKGQAQQRAYYLRRLGVRLPKMTRRMTDRQLEVAQLNALIKKHSK